MLTGPPTEDHWQVSTGPPTEDNWQVSTGPPTEGHWQVSTGPPTEGHWQVLTGPPTEGHWQVLAPGCRTAEPWVVERNSEEGRQTSGSLDAAENVAFYVWELCRPGGFPRKETFQLRLELRLRHVLRHGLRLELRHVCELVA